MTAPVVLLHSLGTDRRLWDPVTPLLANRYQVLTPDAAGHGRSPWPGRIDVAGWVEDLHGVLAGRGPAHVVGLSMGGVQAMALAAAHPELVCSLTVADSFAVLTPDVAAARVAAVRSGVAERGMAGYATHYLDTTLVGEPGATTVRALRDAIAGMSAAAYVGSAEATFHADLTALLPRITARTLVLVGDRDRKTPLPLSEALRDGIPGAILRVVPDAGHLCAVDAPEAFTRELSAFLAAAGDMAGART